MQRITRRTVFTAVNTLLFLALLVFIFGNSLQDRAASTQESLGVLAVLSDFLEKTTGHSSLTEHIVRKLAHFCEFTALGFFTLYLCAVWRRMQSHYIVHSLSFGLACAVIDESLQLLSDRSSQVTDILLDFFGVLCGSLIFLVLYAIYLAWRMHTAHKS